MPIDNKHGQNGEDPIKNKHNLARFFTEQRQVAWVCLAAVIAWGLYGVLGMPQRKDPDVPVRTAMVVIPWQGTKAEQVEQLVTKKIEQAIALNQWATEIKSASRKGIAFVQFDLDERGKYNASQELDDIKLKLDSIQDLPDGAGPVRYIKDFGDTSALMLTVARPKPLARVLLPTPCPAAPRSPWPFPRTTRRCTPATPTTTMLPGWRHWFKTAFRRFERVQTPVVIRASRWWWLTQIPSIKLRWRGRLR